MGVPSGKLLHNYGKAPFVMGTSTNSMAMFKSKLLVYRKVPPISWMIYFMENPNLKKDKKQGYPQK